MFFLSCFCYAFVRICLSMPCGHLLRKGWPLGSRLLCFIVKLSLSYWYPGVRCLTRAFFNVLWHFAMQRYVTIKRFVAQQNYSWTVSRKAKCETKRFISRALRSGLCGVAKWRNQVDFAKSTFYHEISIIKPMFWGQMHNLFLPY